MSVATSFGDESSRPVVDPSTCNGCGTCAEVCASGVLSVRDGALVADLESGFGCIGCQHCAMVCPSGSITVTGRRTSPADLVDLPEPGARATAEALDALLLARRSIRHFKDAPVPREALERIVAATATAPMGIPPSEVGITVYESRDKVRALAGDVAEMYRFVLRVMGNPVVPILARPFMKATKYRQLRTFIVPLAREVVAARDRGADAILYDAPAAMVFHASPLADTADAYVACTYAMVAAESLGLGTTMIGCLCPPIQGRRPLLQRHGIPDGQEPVVALILGWPKFRYRRAVRRPLSSVTWA